MNTSRVIWSIDKNKETKLGNFKSLAFDNGRTKILNCILVMQLGCKMQMPATSEETVRGRMNTTLIITGNILSITYNVIILTLKTKEVFLFSPNQWTFLYVLHQPLHLDLVVILGNWSQSFHWNPWKPLITSRTAVACWKPDWNTNRNNETNIKVS